MRTTSNLAAFEAYNASFDGVALMEAYSIQDARAQRDTVTNFLGVQIKPEYLPQVLKGMEGNVQPLPIPANWHADIAEWSAVLRSVDLAAGPDYKMLELGCGWGCWMANSGVAARSRGLVPRLLGVEADMGHVGFARDCLQLNGFNAASFKVFHGIAAACSGEALFPRQAESGVEWGLQPVFNASPEQSKAALDNGSHEIIPMVSLPEILEDEQHLDLLHLDIQGGEGDMLSNTAAALSRYVSYVVVGTHSREIEGLIFEVMLRNGFVLEIERPAILQLAKNKAPQVVVDGVQGWRNPVLLPL